MAALTQALRSWKRGRRSAAAGPWGDRWPATQLALRRQRRYLRLCIGLTLAGLAVQWVAFSLVYWLSQQPPSPWLDRQPPGVFRLLLGLSGLRYLIPLYIGAWIIPGAVAATIAGDRESGRWAALALTRLTSWDLWVSSVFAPTLPWLGVSLLWSWAYLVPSLASIRPRDPSLEIWQIAPFTLAVDSADAFAADLWGLAVGVPVGSAAFAALAAICAFQTRSPRAALALTYAVVLGIGYTGAAMSCASPILGEWAKMPALTFAWRLNPATLLAPSWMFGGTLYSIPSPFVGRWIVWITVAVFTVLAAVLCAVSLGVVRHARRPER